ncbi:MAG: hypothetical protein ABS70_03585 [Nitrospira sp. SCN 59-13]|nr:MAG: hypothetical protein ABS70_03585 [Nitrospira sp. SCN 59-13]
MVEHELEHLLGGFAADTLTPEERKRLYAAALHDQQLFTALADEQALKELLANPDVRRRLLQALPQSSPTATGGTLTWWGWLRKPAGLAWAGGLAAALFAVTFGTRIYQESLDRSTQSTVTEEARPAVPSMQRAQPAVEPTASAPAPERKAKDNPDAAKNDRRGDKLARREQPDAVKPPERPTSTPLADNATPRGARDALSKQAPMVAVDKESSPSAASADRKLAAPAAPPVAAPQPSAAPPALQGPAGLSAPSAPAQKRSARALFYGEESKPSIGQAKPLGLRYSFVTRGTRGEIQEVTAAMVARSNEPVRITVEATQDSYVQLLQNLGSAGTRLWWPPQETGKISLKLQPGKRTEIPMPPPAENGLITLIIRLSSKPFGPLTMQEVGMLDRFSSSLLIETVSPGTTTGTQEQATYVVSQDPSTSAQLAVEIPVVQ